jgi:hypothetical protein
VLDSLQDHIEAKEISVTVWQILSSLYDKTDDVFSLKKEISWL